MTATKYISVIYWENEKSSKQGWAVDLCDSESSDTIKSFEVNEELKAWDFAEKYAEENGLEIKVP